MTIAIVAARELAVSAVFVHEVGSERIRATVKALEFSGASASSALTLELELETANGPIVVRYDADTLVELLVRPQKSEVAAARKKMLAARDEEVNERIKKKKARARRTWEKSIRGMKALAKRSSQRMKKR